MAQGDLTGELIGERYELVRLLGKGGMGTVYEARNRATLKRCALKILQAEELKSKTELVERFFRESRASSVIESDHIIQIFDSGLDRRGWPFMVMELLQGEDLEHLARRTGPMAPLAVAKIALQAASGLAKAHAVGIVHRDIKPANLFLTKKEDRGMSVKLLDFGIAKIKMDAFHDASPGLTRTGSLLGTPLYMSPEQVRRASQLDGRSDVWSLGIVMFELLAGVHPWGDQASLGELMAAILTADFPMLQDLAPWVPPELAEVVHRATSRDLARRYADAGELRDALFRVVPDGSRLLEEMVVSVSPEQRAVAAPRLEITHDGVFRAGARTQLNATTESASGSKASISRTLVVALVALIAVAGASILHFGRRDAQAEHPLAPAPAAEPQKAKLELAAFELVVRPADAQATVDGKAVLVVDGKLAIRAEVGSTHVVRVTLGDRSHEQVVAVAATGLVPPAVELDVAKPKPEEAAPPTTALHRKNAVRNPPPRPAPARSSPSPAPRRGPSLAEGTDEF